MSIAAEGMGMATKARLEECRELVRGPTAQPYIETTVAAELLDYIDVLSSIARGLFQAIKEEHPTTYVERARSGVYWENRRAGRPELTGLTKDELAELRALDS